MSRRVAMRGAVVVAATALAGATAGCSGPSESAPATSTVRPGGQPRVLLAYFSRPGENYSYGGRTVLDVGNTEVLAGMISQRLRCTVHRIEPSTPYPFDYEETVEQNRREQQDGVRPALSDPLTSLDGYDAVILASPVWNSSAPMIMRTFTEALDFTGKTIHPVTTHAVSGLSGVPAVYRQSCPGAEMGDGLAVQGEEVRDSAPAVERWLRTSGLQ
ncbi:flavodoxin [Williamsia herbipolensis]|uniref:flavodoxin n=1 Tax=Williamsia herbipolensis TaxID=1603258 RepID=UPI000ACB3C6E|nr:flavodoxin [Williamsia herbipolensis]